MTPRALLAAALGCALVACIERAPGAGAGREPVDPAIARAVLVSGARPRIPCDALLGTGIELLGMDAPAELARGASATLTFYWRALEEPETAWRVFVHLEAPGAQRFHADHAPAGGKYPTTAWRRGDVVRDAVTVRVPANEPGAAVQVWVGLHAGSERLPVTRAGPLGSDGENRLLAARIPLR